MESSPDQVIQDQNKHIPPPKQKSKKPIFYAVIAVVIVVIIVAAVMVDFQSHKEISSTIHLGYIPLKTADNITGTNLTFVERSYNNSQGYTIIKSKEILYNSSSGGHIIIILLQFSNASEANDFYNSEMHNAFSNFSQSYITVTNNTYRGFNYTNGLISFSNLYEGISLGHDGSFFFMVYDINIPISNFNELTQEQIFAMT